MATTDSDRVSVITYNGSSWEYLGNTGILGNTGGCAWIALDRSGALYLSYNGGTSFVKYFDGSSWQYVGGVSIAANEGGCANIAINSEGTPFIAFEDLSEQVSVMMYNGSGWKYVGNENMSPGLAAAPALAINPLTDAPYVAFLNDPRFDSLTVMTVGTWAGVTNLGNTIINKVNVYPNPSDGQFTVRISSPDIETVNLAVTNMLGEEVASYRLQTNTDNTLKIDAPTGVYFVSAVASGGCASTRLTIE